MNIHYLHLTDSLGAIEGKLVKCALWLINLVHSQSIMQFILSFFLHGIILSHQIEKVRQKVMKLIWQSHVQRVKLIPYDLYFVWIIVNDLQMLQKIMISFLMQKECDVLTDTSLTLTGHLGQSHLRDIKMIIIDSQLLFNWEQSIFKWGFLVVRQHKRIGNLCNFSVWRILSCSPQEKSRFRIILTIWFA